MMRRALVLLVLLASGCTAPGGDQGADAQCRRQAYDDPDVKSIEIHSMHMAVAGPQANLGYDAAYRKAYQACLRQKGIAVRGGVEAVRPQ